MGRSKQTLFAILAIIVIVAAGAFVYKQFVSDSNSPGTPSGAILPHSPKEKNPNWSPNTNMPPGMQKAGGGG